MKQGQHEYETVTNRPINSKGDPDPFTIALLVLAGISSVGVIVQVARGIRRDKQEERRQIENGIFNSFRGLYRLKNCHERFRTYIDQYDYIDSPLAIGRTPLPPDPETRREVRKLSEEISSTGLELSDQLTKVGDIIADSEYKEKLQSLVLKLDQDFVIARGAKTYRDYHKQIDIVIRGIQDILREIAHSFDVRAPEQS